MYDFNISYMYIERQKINKKSTNINKMFSYYPFDDNQFCILSSNLTFIFDNIDINIHSSNDISRFSTDLGLNC